MARVKGFLLRPVQIVLLCSVVCCVLGGILPEQQETIGNGKIIEAPLAVAVKSNSVQLPASSSADPEQDHVINIGRTKRYVGWGRKPSLRYSKASSTFDHDNLFNKLYNQFDKRLGPEAPISSFRELRMKQKVPNAQILLPHLFSRTSRSGYESDGATPTLSGSDLAMALEQDAPARLSEEDFAALLYLLENYSKNIRNDQE